MSDEILDAARTELKSATASVASALNRERRAKLVLEALRKRECETGTLRAVLDEMNHDHLVLFYALHRRRVLSQEINGEPMRRGDTYVIPDAQTMDMLRECSETVDLAFRACFPHALAPRDATS